MTRKKVIKGVTRKLYNNPEKRIDKWTYYLGKTWYVHKHRSYIIYWAYYLGNIYNWQFWILTVDVTKREWRKMLGIIHIKTSGWVYWLVLLIVLNMKLNSCYTLTWWSFMFAIRLAWMQNDDILRYEN